MKSSSLEKQFLENGYFMELLLVQRPLAVYSQVLFHLNQFLFKKEWRKLLIRNILGRVLAQFEMDCLTRVAVTDYSCF